jgi:hypothetical protein
LVFVECFGFDPLVPPAKEEGEGAADSSAPEDVWGSGYVAAEGEPNPEAETGHRGQREAYGLLWDDDEFVPVTFFEKVLKMVLYHESEDSGAAESRKQKGMKLLLP